MMVRKTTSRERRARAAQQPSVDRVELRRDLELLARAGIIVETEMQQ
jgi:hypothetical protein